MRKFSAKRVFAIFGIVLLVVSAFVGAVLGVLALMGKFKTPIVYPTSLVFLDNDKIVIEEKAYDPYSDIPWDEQHASIYQLQLQGINDSESHPVNQKNCYVWFYQNTGANLITLCEENGKPLVKDTNNRYHVQCNEPIYYMINTVPANSTTNGKVMLMARSENNKAQADVPLTFWIDRKIEQISIIDDNLNNGGIVPTNFAQNIVVGVDIGFDFKYKVQTPLSLKPISKESEKQIELYYVATGYSSDYVAVTQEEISNPESPLNKLITYENGVFSFKSAKAGTYVFKIGAFKTYQYKMDYLASIEGQIINNPNHHRTSCLLSDGITPAMALKTLTVTVENVDVSEVGFRGTNVVLNLYSNKDYITLNGTSGFEGAKDNNLELYMKKGGEHNWVYDNSRFDEVSMDGFDNAWANNKTPTFIGVTYQDHYIIQNLQINDIQHTNIFIDKGKRFEIIEKIETADDQYYCMNGVAVWDTVEQEILMLKEGSYLNFYIVDSTENEIRLANFDYTLTSFGAGNNKTWNIVTKEIPNLSPDEELVMGILVVNKNEKFVLNNFFDTIDVLISEVAIDYEVKTATADLDITFLDSNANGGKTMSFAEKPFEDFVQVNAGSYNAVVLITKEPAIVKTVSNIKFKIDGEDYYLVGDVETDAVTGDPIFINKVIVDEDVSKDNTYATLKLLQFKNKLNESAYDIICSLLKDIGNGVDISEKLDDSNANTIVKSVKAETITINSKYIINTNLLNYGFYEVYDKVNGTYVETAKNADNQIEVYEKTSGHKIVISAPKNSAMIGRIVEYYGVDANFFTTSQETNLWVVGATLEDGELIVEYQTDRCLNDQSTEIHVRLENVNTEVVVPNAILIISGSPEAIFLHDGVGHKIELSKLKTDAEISANYLKVVVGYESSVYTYDFSLQIGQDNYPIARAKNSSIFNTQIAQLAGLAEIIGFQADRDRGQILPIVYDSMDKAVFNTNNLATLTNLVEKDGNTVIKVEIGETVRYLKVVTDTSNFDFTNDKTNFEIDNGENVALSEIVALKYNNTTPVAVAPLNDTKLVYVDNLVCLKYGNGTLIKSGNKTDGWLLQREVITDNGGDPQITYEDVLKIYKPTADSEWEIKKLEAYITLAIRFDVVTVAGSSTIDLTFTSSIDYALGDQWAENKVLYAGTTVLLYAGVQDKNNPDRQHPVIECSESEVKYYIKYQGIEEEITSVNFEVLEKYIGNISIVLKFNNETIYEFTGFVVKPNVIAVNNAVNNQDALETETAHSIADVFTLYKYKNTGFTYGSHVNNLYTTKNADGTLKHLERCTDYSKLSIAIDAEGNANDANYWAYVEYHGDDLSGKYIYNETTLEYESTEDTSRQAGTVYYTKYARANLTTGNENPALYWEYVPVNVAVGDAVSDKFILTASGYETPAEQTAQAGQTYYAKHAQSLYVGAMDEMNTQLKRKIYLQYTYEGAGGQTKVNNVVGSYITITNQHSAVFNMNGENGKLVYKALTEYEEIASVSGFNLQNIEAENLDFTVTQAQVAGAKNTFVLNTILTTELKDVLVKLTYTNALGQTLVTYNEITFIPFSPTENASIETAYSGLDYDLFGTRYDYANVVGKGIEKLVVKSIQDISGNDITTDILKEGYSLGGYIGVAGPVCMVVFKEMQYDTLDVNIEYEIVFTEGGVTYTYLAPLTILNRQAISVAYPENDLDYGAINFKFVSGYEKDGEILSGAKSETGIYSVRVGTFEAIPVYMNSTTKVNFVEDRIKNIQRVIISNRKTPTDATIASDNNVRITIVGYQDMYGLADYIKYLQTSTNEFVLPSAQGNGLAGMLIFKLETASQNTKYYFLYVYCVGSAVSVENNLKVSAYLNGQDLTGATNKYIAQYELTNSTTYGDIVAGLSDPAVTDLFAQVDGNQTYSSIFGTNYSVRDNVVTKLYLYDISPLGATEEYDYDTYKAYDSMTENYFNANKDKIYIYSDPNYSLVDDAATFDGATTYYYKYNLLGKDVTDEIVVLNEKFNTITIGLLYYDGISMYNYGTITIYVQPINKIIVSDSNQTKHEVPNGKFNQTLEGNDKITNCPFDGTWTAEIVSVDGVDYNAIQHGNFSLDSTTLNIAKYVGEETDIIVKYTNNNNTIVYVNYTYKAVILPENNQTMDVGQFDVTSGFKQTIYLTNTDEYKPGTTYKEYFFGNYDPSDEGSYTIIQSENVTVVAAENYVVFTQTNERQQASITIKYNNCDGDVTRTFNFNIAAGVYIKEETGGSENGLTSSTAVPTNLNEVSGNEYFKSVVGSTLPIYYYQPNGKSYYVFEIGGLKIYTCENSKLALTFDNESYVLNTAGNILSEGAVYQISPTATTGVDITQANYLSTVTPTNISFINAPTNKALVMNIKVYTSDDKLYIQRNFFINVIQTYSGLVAKYCSTDGATTHENVVHSTYKELVNELMYSDTKIATGRRVQLRKVNGDILSTAELENMGFRQDGNPNQIQYVVGGNASIDSDNKITFNKVTTNTYCSVLLTNKAGMEEVEYKYQIMAGTSVDGLDSTTTNGYKGDKYWSFSIAEEDNDSTKEFWSDRFVLGAMLDLQNPGVLSIAIDGSLIAADYITKIENLADDNLFETYSNAIQYKATKSNYELYFIFDMDTYQIYLHVHRPANQTLANDIVVPIKMSGINGDYDDQGTILTSDHKILLHSYSVVSNYEDTSDSSVYAYYYIDLEQDNKFVKKAGSATITYQLAKSTYIVNNTTRTIEQNDNELFSFENGKKLSMNAVGEDVKADLKFDVVVTIGGTSYVIDNLTYKVIVKRNLQFMVNTPTTVVKDSTLETFFTLTKEVDTTPVGDPDHSFDIGVDFVDNADVVATDYDSGQYKVLAFDLYRLSNKGSVNPSLSNLLMDKSSSSTVSLVSLEYKDYVTVTNSGITFHKDFTGTLELELSVVTGNGTYSEIWTIHVSGIKDIKAKGSPTTKLRTSSHTSYASGTQVKLINNNDNGYDVGILMYNAKGFPNSDVEMAIEYSYKVFAAIDGADTKRNEDLFNSNGYVGEVNDIAVPVTTDNILSVTLPSVPLSNNQNPQAYIVVYRVYVEYLGLEYDDSIVVDEKQEVKVVYCAYMVENCQQISLVNNATVNVDDLTGNKLNLFYYAETFANGSIMYTYGTNLIIGASVWSGAAANNGIYTLSGVTPYYYRPSTNEISTDMNFENQDVIYARTSQTTQTTGTLFNVSFNSMMDYVNFISPFITSSDENYVEIGTAKFELEKISNNLFGIDLSKKWGGGTYSAADPLFTNEMVEDFKLIQSNVAVFKVDKYSPSNPNGFKLTTSSTITANTTDVTISTLFLEKYFALTDAGRAINEAAGEDVISFYTNIIGIGYDPIDEWVEHGGVSDKPDDDFAVITVPTNDNDYVWTIRKAVYTGGSLGIYKIEKEFFYLYKASTTRLIVPDYSKVGYESTFFKIAYNKDASQQELDLGKGFTVWEMVDYVLTPKTLAATSLSISSFSDLPDGASADDLKIKIDNDILNDYKLEYPNKRDYEPATATIEISGIEFECKIVFALPDYPMFNCQITDIDANNNLTITLKGTLHIPKSDGEYEELADNNLGKVVDVVQTTPNVAEDFIKKYDRSGDLVLNGSKINQYFVDNATESKLYLLFTLTTDDYNTVEFQVIITKPH